MAESMEVLERRIDRLRTEARRAATTGDQARAQALRAELRQAEREWDEALAAIQEQTVSPEADRRLATAPSLLPLRDLVHQVLTLLSAPAAPRLIVTVHEAFFAGEIVGARLTSLRRDEERSFLSAPFSRPYYICSALTSDRFAAARGLLAVSTWPTESRVIGPLSPRVDFLTAAIRVAEHMVRVSDRRPIAARLLWRFAANIPGAASRLTVVKPAVVARAASAELSVHQDADRSHREAAARRARAQLDDVAQLFGTRLQAVPKLATGTDDDE